MSNAVIYVGQRILVEGEFRLLGVPTDPMIVRCVTQAPNGSTVMMIYPSTVFTRRDLGLFEAAVAVNEAGTWVVRMEGAGTVDAVHEVAFRVEPSATGVVTETPEPESGTDTYGGY